jgi:DNA-binding MarR family transcriptional regulator
VDASAKASAAAAETSAVAAELRVVLGQLIRRLRVEHAFPISQGSVLGRLDREGPRSVADLAVSERVRPQSMAQTVGELEAAGMVERNPDPGDRRRALVSLTESGHSTLLADRRNREGWLVKAIEELPEADRAVVERAIPLLRELADADV